MGFEPGRGNALKLPEGSGNYVLILESADRKIISVGKLGKLELQPGFYLYAGSARGPGGLQGRLKRHLRVTKDPHWHIDYLRQRSKILEIWISQDSRQLEHRSVGVLSEIKGFSEPLPGFGSSDCRCFSHLFYSARRPEIREFQACFRATTSLETAWSLHNWEGGGSAGGFQG